MLDIDKSIQQDEPDSITPLRDGSLILRPAQSSDFDKLSALAANPRIAKNLSADSCGLIQAPITMSNGKLNGNGRQMVLTNAYHQPIGSIGYCNDRASNQTYFSVWLDVAHWNRGFGTLATQAMMDLAFSKDELSCIFATARVSSMASKRLLEKCGFQYCGTGMTRSAFYKGMIPTDRYKLDRRIWQALRDWNHLTPNKGAA